MVVLGLEKGVDINLVTMLCYIFFTTPLNNILAWSLHVTNVGVMGRSNVDEYVFGWVGRLESRKILVEDTTPK